MVASAVAGAFDFGEQAGRSPTDTVVAKLATSEVLVVLDNCEHLVGGVTALVERLLSACPRLTVLATSRARLMVPVRIGVRGAGSVARRGRGDGDGDAMALFVERAAMAGWSSPYPNDRARIAAICEELDGVALAIELAAARVATFGLDGLEAGSGQPTEPALRRATPRRPAPDRPVGAGLELRAPRRPATASSCGEPRCSPAPSPLPRRRRPSARRRWPLTRWRDHWLASPTTAFSVS